jgi:hypothetical protein
MMPKKLTLSSISSFTWGQTPRQQDNKTQTCHLGDNDIQLSVRNKDLRLLVLWSLDAYMLWPKKSWNSLSLSLSQELSISMQNSTINQPKNYGFHSVQNSLSTNSINQQKHPKVMEFLSRTLSWYKFQPTQKPKDHGILSRSLSLSQCKFYRSTKPKTPEIMPSSPE